MDTLRETVRSVMEGYAKRGYNSRSHLMQNEDGTLFTVITVPEKSASFVSLLVRVIGQKVIIERDQNDKMLVDALIQAGVSREKIVLAYAGEPVPESA